jgi:hypothetical protein
LLPNLTNIGNVRQGCYLQIKMATLSTLQSCHGSLQKISESFHNKLIMFSLGQHPCFVFLLDCKTTGVIELPQL